MRFTEFEELLSKVIDLPLPGIVAQKKMLPSFRAEELKSFSSDHSNAKKAAVLVLFYPNLDGETCFVLIERVVYLGVHSGQISFPGGKADVSDSTLWDTAIREANEEVGVSTSEICEVLKLTHVFIPPSNFLVHPFVGLVRTKPDFVAEEKEVENILEVSLANLLSSENEMKGWVTASYAEKIEVPMFLLNHKKVWGATASILAEMKDLILSALRE